jgi:hypothetical protein
VLLTTLTQVVASAAPPVALDTAVVEAVDAVLLIQQMAIKQGRQAKTEQAGRYSSSGLEPFANTHRLAQQTNKERHVLQARNSAAFH